MRRLLYISAILIVINCCKKTNNLPVIYSATGIIAGSDTTCGGWLIRASDGTVFDPLNIDTFTVTRKDGQSVNFTYHYTQQSVMICLMGQLH